MERKGDNGAEPKGQATDPHDVPVASTRKNIDRPWILASPSKVEKLRQKRLTKLAETAAGTLIQVEQPAPKPSAQVDIIISEVSIP